MNFTITKFGDFAVFKYGKMPKKSEIKENGRYPIYSGYRYVGYYDDYNTETNQLIIVARGVGGTGDVKLTNERCYLTNLSISAQLDENVALPQYLYYYFSLRNLRYLDSGSAQSQITISDLQKVEIPLPNIENQIKLVNCLGVLDYKIRTNEVINNNLPTHPCVARIAAKQRRQIPKTDKCLHTDGKMSDRGGNEETA